MPITNLPTPPTRSDPVSFNSRADAFLTALPAFATEANALLLDVNSKQTAAATSAANALASELAAAASSTATAWVSGTTYAIGNVRFSPITYLSYRRKTAGAGTTDPSADSTNWQLINGTGNVDLNSTQTLTNKTMSTGSIWNGTAIPVANGGTGATTAANARSNLDVPSTSGANATGTWNISISGNAVVTTSQVNTATADSAVGAVGTYAMLQLAPNASVLQGDLIAGSDLRYSPASGLQGVTPNGTWRAMGRTVSGGSLSDRTTLWLRIS